MQSLKPGSCPQLLPLSPGCAVLGCAVISNSLPPPWTIARQVPLSIGFSRQEYWSGLPCPPPGDLPNPGIKPRSPALQGDSLLSEPPGRPKNTGVGSLSLLQGIFLTQKLNRGLLHCRQILYQLSYQGSWLLAPSAPNPHPHPHCSLTLRMDYYRNIGTDPRTSESIPIVTSPHSCKAIFLKHKCYQENSSLKFQKWFLTVYRTKVHLLRIVHKILHRIPSLGSHLRLSLIFLHVAKL